MVWDEATQRSSFAKQWDLSGVRVIECDKNIVGWLQVSDTASEIWIQQFFITPEYQRRGIGTVVLHRLLAELDSRGKPISLTVLKNNPVRRLYERCGFSVVAEIGVKFEMRRAGRSQN